MTGSIASHRISWHTHLLRGHETGLPRGAEQGVRAGEPHPGAQGAAAGHRPEAGAGLRPERGADSADHCAGRGLADTEGHPRCADQRGGDAAAPADAAPGQHQGPGAAAEPVLAVRPAHGTVHITYVLCTAARYPPSSPRTTRYLCVCMSVYLSVCTCICVIRPANCRCSS